MKNFSNISDLGNEAAIRRGTKVPDGDVNIALVKTPKMTPENNVLILDTSTLVDDNSILDKSRTTLMYANTLGVLEDEHGNQAVGDEYPCISDTFMIEDGKSYSAADALPFVHKSRFFHADASGLVSGSNLVEYSGNTISVIDSQGKDYVDDNGKPLYVIKLARLDSNVGAYYTDRSTGIYRIYVYVKEIGHSPIHLSYNKVEIGTNGAIKNQIVGHTEILNPQSYFHYIPEETDVVDGSSDHKNVYSTKIINKKSSIIGENKIADGYRIFVPKKATTDPRLYQMFRWRVKCDFVHEHKTSLSTSASSRQINVGVIASGSNEYTAGDYVFYNLENSNYNKANIKFVNPLATTTEKMDRAYWQVDLTNISDTDLAKFDVLVMAPVSKSVDVSNLISRFTYFTDIVGGSLIIDTNATSVINGLGITVSDTYDSVGTVLTGSATSFLPLYSTNPTTTAPNDSVLMGSSTIGGWDISSNSAVFDSISSAFSGVNGTFTQGIQSYPTEYTPLVNGTNSSGGVYPFLLRKNNIRDSGSATGSIYLSTMPFISSINNFFNNDGTQAYLNDLPTITRTDLYSTYLSSPKVEGAYKLFYNMILSGTKGKRVPVSSGGNYSSSFTTYSKWRSDWVINGSKLNNTERSDNNFVLLSKNQLNDTSMVWQKELSKISVKNLVEHNMSSEDLIYSHDASRTYSIEVTNSLVEKSDIINGQETPKVWTDAYSPSFIVPSDTGYYVTRSELVQGDYEPMQMNYKSYPPKKYDLQVQSSYLTDYTSAVDITTDFVVTGTYSKIVKYKDTTKIGPPTTTTTLVPKTVEEKLIWSNNGTQSLIAIANAPWTGAPRPNGINTWQEANYFSPNTSDAWPFWGMKLRYSTAENNNSEIVKTIQASLNLMIFWAVITGVPYLVEDGLFGPITKAGVTALQSQLGAKFIDGIVGAETWGIIGMMMLRIGYALDLLGEDGKAALSSETNYKRYWKDVFTYIDMSNISNGDTTKTFVKRSWIRNGPSSISDIFNIVLSNSYDIHAVEVTPYVEGVENTCVLNSIGVFSTIQSMTNFDVAYCKFNGLSNIITDNITHRTSMSPINGRQIVVQLSQDKSSGNGSSRVLGVRDIAAYTNVTKTVGVPKVVPGTPQIVEGLQRGYNETFSYKGSVTVNSSGKKYISISLADLIPMNAAITDPNIASVDYGNAVLTGITVSDSRVTAVLDSANTTAGMLTYSFSTDYVSNGQTTHIVNGDELPSSNNSFTYYAKDQSGFVSPVVESGWISKNNGIKLFCDSSGDPVGFPALPTMIPHPDHTLLKLVSLGTDASIRYGFYDFGRKEFISSGYGGEQILSYGEYMRRGPNNVFIAALTEYETTQLEDLPSGDDAPLVPRRWAMPVYSVCHRTSSSIGLEPLPDHLGPMDLWPIPIRVGSFTKSINIESKYNTPITHWTKSYEGSTLIAHYSIPEAEKEGWSLIYGKPNIDIKDEIPDILSDTHIRLRQVPILVIDEPESNPSKADSSRPIFTIYTRVNTSSSWVAMGWNGVSDYNVNTGDIFLSSPLASVDQSLIKVSYTTTSKVYHFKQYGSQRINLNPYAMLDESLIDKPIYVYIVPEYVYDGALGGLISASIETSTLRWTTDSGVFNKLDSAIYNPLAIKIGVIYVSTDADINKLQVIDTRTRGGGISEDYIDNEIQAIFKDAENYWDIDGGYGKAYQGGGYVLVRLPEELKTRFNDDLIIHATIRRNLPIGTAYSIEDMNGNAWR